MTDQQFFQLHYDNWKTNIPWECNDGSEEEEHSWKFLGSSPDGDSFYKCRECGKEYHN